MAATKKTFVFFFYINYIVINVNYVLIFKSVITASSSGFRVQFNYEIKPILIAFGEILGSGVYATKLQPLLYYEFDAHLSIPFYLDGLCI